MEEQIKIIQQQIGSLRLEFKNLEDKQDNRHDYEGDKTYTWKKSEEGKAYQEMTTKLGDEIVELDSAIVNLQYAINTITDVSKALKEMKI